MPTPKSWTDRAKVHLEEERSLPMTRPFGELPAMTEPQTAAGRVPWKMSSGALLDLLSRVILADGKANSYIQSLAAAARTTLSIEAEADAPVAQPAPLDARANRYESALNRIAVLGMDAPAFGPEPEDFYRDQLMTAIGIAARAIRDAAADSQPAPVAQPAPLDRERLAAAMYDAVNDADQGGPNWSESPGYSHRVWLRNADAVIARLAATDRQPSASEEE